MKVRITVIVENQAEAPFLAEHGLSLLIESEQKNTGTAELLFDTGAGTAFANNCKVLGIEQSRLQHVALSHGHNDHTGGLDCMEKGDLYCVDGISKDRYSLHPGKALRQLTMPESCQKSAGNMQIHRIDNCCNILPGMYLTGPIPRISGEDTGGPFYLDPEGRTPDLIDDEQALLLSCGILIQGCSHAGIINTLTHCRKNLPHIPIHTIVGGLHLLHASRTRLQQTADALKEWQIKKLYLMHCTGENAVEFLRNALPDCSVETPHTGSRLCFEFPER